MKSKTLEFKIPDYLTVGQYMEMAGSDKEGKVVKMIRIISSLTGYDKKEVEKWSLESLNKVFKAYSDLADTKNEFHPLLEWNGTLYGYSHINQMTLGCYVDLENLSKDIENNLHKIAAILYRPVKKHRFGSIIFAIKQKLKMVKNTVENVFDYYTIEDYDSDKRRDVEQEFKEFPAHVLLGALSFFLSTGSQYLSDTVYSKGTITKETNMENQTKLLTSLLLNTGAGSGLFTHSPKVIYSKFQAKAV